MFFKEAFNAFDTLFKLRIFVKIKKIISQHRRDFQAEYECEHCGEVERNSGYDDENFHQNVVPKMVCKICQKTADANYRALAPRYKQWETV